MNQPDLFGEPSLAGLSQAGGFVAQDEERMLIAAAALSPFRYHGWLGKRLTASYGWSYDFDGASFAPAEAIPGWLLPVREKAARFAGLPPGVLAPRSIYHLTGETRHQWEHSIAAMAATRWSITFRSLSEKGRSLQRA